MLDKNKLALYLPETSIELVNNWVSNCLLQIRISKDRLTKTGDYRPPDRNVPFHRISINQNLNKYAFLITFTHEFAHLITWNAHKRKARPHGDEWKDNYRRLLFLLIDNKVFPEEIESALLKTLVKGRQPLHASEYNLSFILSKYDSDSVKQFLDELVVDSIFSIPNGNIFRKGTKIRTRYKCYCLNNKKWYLISPAMRVKPISNALDFT